MKKADHKLFHRLNKECNRLFLEKGVDHSIEYLKQYHKENPKDFKLTKDFYNYYLFIKHYNLAIKYSERNYEHATEQLEQAINRFNKISIPELSSVPLRNKIKKLKNFISKHFARTSDDYVLIQQLINKKNYHSAWRLLKSNPDEGTLEICSKIRASIKTDLKSILSKSKNHLLSNRDLEKLRVFCINLFPILTKSELKLLLNKVNSLPIDRSIFAGFKSKLEIPNYGVQNNNLITSFDNQLVILEVPKYPITHNKKTPEIHLPTFKIKDTVVNFDTKKDVKYIDNPIKKLDKYIDLQIEKLNLNEQ